MLETDLDTILAPGKILDAREFAQQLILRGQPFHLSFLDGARTTSIPDCVVLSLADVCNVPRLEVMLPTLHPADPTPRVSVQVVPLTKGSSLSIGDFTFYAKDTATFGRVALFPVAGSPTLANILNWAAASYCRVSIRVHDLDDDLDTPGGLRVNVKHHALHFPAKRCNLHKQVSLLTVPVIPQRNGILIHAFLKAESDYESIR